MAAIASVAASSHVHGRSDKGVCGGNSNCRSCSSQCDSHGSGEGHGRLGSRCVAAAAVANVAAGTAGRRVAGSVAAMIPGRDAACVAAGCVAAVATMAAGSAALHGSLQPQLPAATQPVG